MKKYLLCVAIFCASSGLAYGQVPDVGTIQTGMNEGLELDYRFFQEVTNVQIIRGGAINTEEALFLCTADLVWKLSSVEFAEIMQQEIDEEIVLRAGDENLWKALNLVLAEKLRRIGDFVAGGIAIKVRFRVRLELAGTDWIVTDSKVKGLERNPLDIIDKGTY